ncbi:23S ribosomal RNA methyltransferase [Microthyrium microscopicum]|uniref:rRNA methyltransferase 2, mitochondrial n=1 Tax=Microthyrium microscopicum TaxID=703497 RepID=A0A6A6TZC5_9PEZI|nr:23S ribosomal RNA methyltransferase [Microthyrium microscopicum]
MLHNRILKTLIDSSSVSCTRTSYNGFIACAFPRGGLRQSSSSTRWKTRQVNDRFSKEAKVQGLKSRAAFKLLEMNQKYRLFKPGQTVVDLGYAPGSWSQVAVDRVSPNGRVVGIDIIPAQPPRGVSTIQGNFLSPAIQEEVRAYLLDPDRGRPVGHRANNPPPMEAVNETNSVVAEGDVGYMAMERSAHLSTEDNSKLEETKKKLSLRARDEQAGRVVDVVLSDMCAPWDQTTGFWQRSISDPYRRMLNTTGNGSKDHFGSMDLCMAGLSFCFTTLRTGGHFLCKYYSGGDDKNLEKRLKALFEKVHREKPEASRKDSREAYFVALRRKEIADESEVLKPLE